MKRLLLALSILPVAFQETSPWRIVYEAGGKLHSVKGDGSDARAETGEAPPKGVLSPDGKKRVYASLEGGQVEIWVSDADGKNPKRLTNDLWFDSSPSWTSDGKRIVFESSQGRGGGQVYIMDADGSNTTCLTDHADGARGPRVSPAGDRIAYMELHPERSKLPPSTLRTMDLSGRDSKVLIEKTQMQGHAWSPKGDRLACSLVQELRILELPSGKTVKSFKLGDVHKDLHAHAAYGLLWRPDGGAIACTIQFLGGRRGDSKVFGDDLIFILPFEGKPVVIEAGGPAGPVRWTR